MPDSVTKDWWKWLFPFRFQCHLGRHSDLNSFGAAVNSGEWQWRLLIRQNDLVTGESANPPHVIQCQRGLPNPSPRVWCKKEMTLEERLSKKMIRGAREKVHASDISTANIYCCSVRSDIKKKNYSEPKTYYVMTDSRVLFRRIEINTVGETRAPKTFRRSFINLFQDLFSHFSVEKLVHFLIYS